jgi:hypothetical protein
MSTETASKKKKKKTRRTKSVERTSDGMRKEYDMSGAVRGKFAKVFARDVLLVKLAPDVAEHFPDAKTVNNALRAIIKVIEELEPASRASTKKAS